MINELVSCLCEDEYTEDVTLILTLNDSGNHLTLFWGESHTRSEACTTKPAIPQWGVWQDLGHDVTIGAKMKLGRGGGVHS